ncbi:MAG: flagellar type III secretion system pore protein FliP [Candidatus Sericytochromatia bacterium]|nr:flagellar type III secretion system pore protein FliP [Candidatus Sericytochromatia bacterium]
MKHIHWNKRKLALSVLLLLGLLLCLALPVLAQTGPLPTTPQDPVAPANLLDTIDLRAPMKLSELGTPLQLIVFMSLLTILPFIFIMTTSFIRTVIVLSFLRTAMGTQTNPPNQVVVGIAIFLTLYTMAPVWEQINNDAIVPYLDNNITQSVAVERAVTPLKTFMLKHTSKQELGFFIRIAKQKQPQKPSDVPLHIVVPAYMVSELTTGFKMGFVLFLPFLIIDLVVANTLLALGMMMLSPVTISLPFKILVFTMADGWFLILQAIVTSFHI